jgi:ribosomal protein S18 acetylase RimI-like enzyme
MVRAATRDELPALSRLWYDGWRDAHVKIVPESLARTRTIESFRERLSAALSNTRVLGPQDRPLGFHVTKGEELYQFYVAAEARGGGAAGVLMADAEESLAARGVKTAWLACAIGNDRAARFYEKSGWRRVGSIVESLETSEGPFDLEVWRYEKELRCSRR